MADPTADDFSLDDDSVAIGAAGEIMDTAPTADEAVILQVPTADETPTEQEAPILSGGETDAAGERWDATKHSANKAKTSKGLWKKRRGSQSSVARSDKSTQLAAADQAAQRAAIEARARGAGIAAANSIFLIGTALGGEEWTPRNEPLNEKAMMEQAWGDYFIAKGVTDFPPGVALLMCLTMYAAPRFTMPKTQQRARGLKAWVALRIAKRKLKKELKKRGIVAQVEIVDGALFLDGEPYRGAQSNHRHERVREVHASEADPGARL